jgi:prepilin-type N-terminal cleavage/methylation domain-containing protein
MSSTRALPYRSRAMRGYTAIEVLMAITVMAIGAAGVMSMVKATVLGNLDARKTDIANAIARTWVERLRRDAMMWTSPGPTNGTGSNIATAKIINAGVGTIGNWFLPNQYLPPAANNAPISPGFDILGRDLLTADITPNLAVTPQIPGAFFCAHVRLTWLTANELLRADVRVIWPRAVSNNDTSKALPADGVCGAVATSNTPNPLIYHALYVTTSLRGNPQ